MTALSPKPVIMITAFGTTSPDGQKDLENVDSMVCARYPDHEVRWAITSPFIVRRLKENGQTALFARQVSIRNREQLLDELREEGKTNVVIQPLLVMTGAEYFDVLLEPVDGLNVEYGYPLLGHPDNTARVVKALEPRFGGADAVTLICTHGNDKVPGYCIPLMLVDNYVRKNYQNVFVTTLHGVPGTGPAFADTRKSGLKKVKFVPFLIVAGDHVTRDIMADTPDSYKTQLGLEATADAGMGNDPAVMSIWIESIDWSLARLEG